MRHGLGVVAAGTVLVLGACGNAAPGGGDALPRLPFAGSAGATAAASRDEAGAAADALLMPVQATEYVLARGAEAPARSAPAYRLVPDDVDAGRVARLAAAFGLEAGVERSEGAGYWTVRSGQAELGVEQPGGSGPGYWNFQVTEASVSAAVAVACTDEGECPEPPPTTVPAGLPSASEAEAKARRILAGAGIDVAGAEVTVEGDAWRTVLLRPRLDGRLVTGLQTAVTFGAHARVEHASGFLGRFEAVGDYPLVSLEEALERVRTQFGGQPRVMTDAAGDEEPTGAGGPGGSGGSGGSTGAGGPGAGSEPYAGGGGPGRVPATVPGEEPPATIEPPGFGEGEEPPATIEPPGFGEGGEPPPGTVEEPPAMPPPRVVELTGAEVVLELVYPRCPGDPTWLVPAFAFQPDGPIVVAVAGEHLSGLAPAAAGGAPVDGGDDPVPPCPGQDPAGREPAGSAPGDEPAVPPSKEDPAPPAVEPAG